MMASAGRMIRVIIQFHLHRPCMDFGCKIVCHVGDIGFTY